GINLVFDPAVRQNESRELRYFANGGDAIPIQAGRQCSLFMRSTSFFRMSRLVSIMARGGKPVAGPDNSAGFRNTDRRDGRHWFCFLGFMVIFMVMVNGWFASNGLGTQQGDLFLYQAADAVLGQVN